MRLSVLFLLGVGVSTTIALPVEIFGADDRPEDERENGRLGACIMSVLNRAVVQPGETAYDLLDDALKTCSVPDEKRDYFIRVYKPHAELAIEREREDERAEHWDGRAPWKRQKEKWLRTRIYDDEDTEWFSRTNGAQLPHRVLNGIGAAIRAGSHIPFAPGLPAGAPRVPQFNLPKFAVP